MTYQSHSFLTDADRAQIRDIHKRASIRQITREVCEEAEIPVCLVLGPGRDAHLCRVRETIYDIATRHGFSLTQIGRVFQRDHTTVMSGLRNIRKRRGEA